MDSKEMEELLTALQMREENLQDKFDSLADSGDNISAKGVKRQLQVVRRMITKIYNGNIVIKDDQKRLLELDLRKQKEILLDLAYTLLKELKEGELGGNNKLRDSFLTQAENRLQEIEEL